MNQPRRQLSGTRKLLYYAGMVTCVIGVLLFLSTFVTFLANFGNFNNFDAQVRSGGYRAFGGMLWLILLSPTLATAAEPYSSEDEVDHRANAIASLRAKLIEAERLASEITRLREAAGEPRPNLRLRVRIVELSLTKAKNLGVPYSIRLDGNAVEVDRQLNLLNDKYLARVSADETLVVANGSEARLHTGAELPADSQGASDRGQQRFWGTEIAVSPKLQADGRLRIQLVCKETRPVTRSGEEPQLRVHDLSTVAELAPGECIAIPGRKEERVETTVRGPLPAVAVALGRVTDTVNQIQTFVVVSRESELADQTAAMRERTPTSKAIAR